MPEYALPIFFAVLPVLLALLRAYALGTACSVSRNTPLQARPGGLVAYQADALKVKAEPLTTELTRTSRTSRSLSGPSGPNPGRPKRSRFGGPKTHASA